MRQTVEGALSQLSRQAQREAPEGPSYARIWWRAERLRRRRRARRAAFEALASTIVVLLGATCLLLRGSLWYGAPHLLGGLVAGGAAALGGPVVLPVSMGLGVVLLLLAGDALHAER